MDQQTRFFHNVYFWLNEGAAASDADQIADGCRTHLTSIPGVLRLTVGKPAGTPREVVDNSYGLALLLEFASKEAHDLYQDHADHHKFIDECKAYWSRVRIYDTLVD
jgi:hypothetical protein